MPQIPPVYQFAISAAIAASKAIMHVYQQDFESQTKQDGSPVTAADLSASACIEEILTPLGIPITGEEAQPEAYSQRKYWSKSWCIDPLDGTREFIRRNGEFAVNIALIEHSRAVFGLIASPTEQEILLGSKEFGVFIFNFSAAFDHEKWKQVLPKELPNQPLILSCSRSHPNEPALQFINKLKVAGHEVDFLKKGSALKFFDLALGKADVYARFAPSMEWDIAAGQAILEALGGEVVNPKTNEPLHYNKANLLNPYFIARTKAMKDLI